MRSPHQPWVLPPGFGDAPVGAVIAFAGTPAASPTAPAAAYQTNLEASGWMICDGRTLDTHLYPHLFAVLGYLYGGSGASFALPDYRGYFLRGANDAAGKDPDPTMRVAPPGGTQDGIGSTQTSAIQMHEHDYDYALDSAPSQSGQGAAGTITSKTQATVDGPIKGVGGDAVTVSMHETRPINVYVNYIIKYSCNLSLFVT